MSLERTAALLIAHGSRRKDANDDLVHLADEVKRRGRYDLVEIAYLEVTPPTIADGGRACARAGATRVLMLPYFLSAGNHVTEDLERHRRDLSVEFPATEFVLCAPLGLHPLIVDVVCERLEQGRDRLAQPAC